MVIKDIKRFIRPFFNFLYLSGKITKSRPHIALHSVSGSNYLDNDDPNKTIILSDSIFNKLNFNSFDLSFDDGYRDNIIAAQKYYDVTGRKSTLFVATRFVFEYSWQFNFELYEFLKTRKEYKIQDFHSIRMHLKQMRIEKQKKWFSISRLGYKWSITYSFSYYR